MPPDETAYVLAPRLGAAIDPRWKDAVAALPGVRVVGRDGAGMQVTATPEGAAAVRALHGDALRVEPASPRTRDAPDPSYTE